MDRMDAMDWIIVGGCVVSAVVALWGIAAFRGMMRREDEMPDYWGSFDDDEQDDQDGKG